jgi:Na+:H+ antiporter, NhaC family
MDANALVCGGAVLSGSYFGDRISPLSTSALLVRVVTRTDLSGNFRAMAKSCALPFAAAIAFYGLVGFAFASSAAAGSVEAIDALGAAFDQGLVALVPAVLVLVLPLLRVDVKGAMGASIVAAAAVCVFVRGMAPADLLRCAVFGFSSANDTIQQLMGGGGLLSMVNVAVVVCLSSSYSGLFEGTGLLDGVRGHIESLAQHFTPFVAVLIVSIPACMIACNQTLATMLVQQLCSPVEPDSRSMALDLEDTVILISPLIPWAIACSATIQMCSAPELSWLAAVYLWLVPLWRLVLALGARRIALLDRLQHLFVVSRPVKANV